MGYSIKDLENAAKTTNYRLEQRSQERGEALASHVLQKTSQGRGLWFIFLWPAWIGIFSFSGVFLTKILVKFGIGSPISWLGMIGGLILASSWYSSEFTIQHPFWSSIIGYIFTIFFVVFFAQKIGITI